MGKYRWLSSDNHAACRRVVIIGEGFGGLAAARQLAQAPFDVIIVDRHDCHLFQPSFYQVTTGRVKV